MRVVELEQSCNPSFARHETFHPRFGWLSKAYEHTPEHGQSVFLRPDSTVVLGVGKNMVNAIRYWSVAFGVLEPFRLPGARVESHLVTPFARTVFGPGGWDPYLEDTATLWLLHWSLLQPTCTAPSWWIAFNLMTSTQFDDETLATAIRDAVAAVDVWDGVVMGSIKKDADCLIRMYTQRRTGRQGLDDLFDCPFRELGLIQPVAGEPRSYRFNMAADDRTSRPTSRRGS